MILTLFRLFWNWRRRI